MADNKLAIKEGHVEIKCQFGHETNRLLLDLKIGVSSRSYLLEITARRSNFSSRMTPPVPTRKKVLQLGENSRRHKIRAYSNISGSPYMRWLDSDRDKSKHVCKEGSKLQGHEENYQENAASCSACIMDQWLDGNRQLPPPLPPPAHYRKISSCSWYGVRNEEDSNLISEELT